MKENITEKLNRPRKLGSEWAEWNGTLEENNGDLDTIHWYFIGLFILSLTLISATTLSILYLSYPRLEQIHPLVGQIIFFLTCFFLLLIFIHFCCVVLTVLTQKPFVFYLKGKEFVNSPLVSFSLYIGEKIGYSKDRLKNSLMKIGNSITKSLYPQVKPDDLLILVPRCLSKWMREEFLKLTEKYGVHFHTANGGNAARELLVTEQPKAIIGVACERDLFSGLQDVNGSIPVIAIANKRPQGPCINTYIDLSEMEDAICFFLGVGKIKEEV